MKEFGLRYARRNLLIGRGGEAAALYRARMVSYPFLPVADKWTQLGRLEAFATLVGADFSIWRVQRSYPAERYGADLAGSCDPAHTDREGWTRFLAEQEDRLRDLDSHLPEVYVAVSLGEPSRGAFGSLDRGRRRLEELAGVGAVAPISGSVLEELAAAEERVYHRLAATIGLRRARTSELQWLLRRGATRGVAEPEFEDAWAPDALILGDGDGLTYEPLESDLWRLASEPMVEDAGEPPSLEVGAEAGPVFQTFMCAGTLADEAQFPGPAELLFDPIDSAGFPVDAVLHARWIGNRDALGQIRKRILDADQSYREASRGHGGPGWQSEEDRELAREYEAVLQSSAHPPMLRATLGVAVGAASRPELERRVGLIRERFGDVALHRPRGLQHRLFFDHLPRTDGGAVADYRQQMTVEQFAAMVPTATGGVGSATGTYLGYTTSGTRRPVRFDPTEASRTARPTGVLLAGTLGSGKTLAAQAVAFAAERRGSLVIDVDPKPDHRFEEIPELAGRVEILELSGDPVHRGKLDPLRIAPEELREEIASSYLLDLLPDPPPAWENAIERAVRDAVRAGERSLGRVIDRLRDAEGEAARDAADALDVLSDFGLARLGFSGGEAEADIELPASVLTIRTPGLSLPDPGVSRETYSRVPFDHMVVSGWVGSIPEKGPRVERPIGVRKEVDPENGISETEALSKLMKLMGTYVAPVKKDKITVSEFCPKFVSHKRSKNRATTTMTAIDVAIRCHIEPEFGDRYMDEIEADEVEDWLAKELETASPKSVKNWRSVLNSIFELGLKKKVVSDNIVAQTEAPYVPKTAAVDVMTTADVQAVRDACPDTLMGRMLSLIVLVATRCGLRESEIIALRWKNVMWETSFINVVEGHVRGETKLPKGKQGRVTPMPEIVKVALYAWFKITKFNQPEDLVFGHPDDGSELNASSLNERFKEAVIRAGIRPTELRRYKKRDGSYELRDYVELTFHDCRHAWASWCLSNGMPQIAVMEWGGWEDEKALSVYRHFIPNGFEVNMLNAAVEREHALPVRAAA